MPPIPEDKSTQLILSLPKHKCKVATHELFPSIGVSNRKNASRNRRKMSSYGLVAEKSLFLKDKFQDKFNISASSTIQGVVIGVTNKECNYWTICAGTMNPYWRQFHCIVTTAGFAT